MIIKIILLNYNNYVDTIECVNSLKKIEYDGQYNIVIVDNNSNNDSVKQLIDYYKLISSSKGYDTEYYTRENLTLLINKENRGFSAGNNFGIKFNDGIEYDYIWLLNNDTVVEKRTLVELTNYSLQYRLDLCSSRIKDYYKSNISEYDYLMNFYLISAKKVLKSNSKPKLDYLSGTSLLISTNCISKVGLLDENYFLYYEDADYTQRVKKCGLNIGLCVNSVVNHKEGGSTGLGKARKINSFTYQKYLESKYRFGKTYGKSQPILLLSMFLSICKALLRRQYKVSINIIKYMFGFVL
ncbi:glycosyltransferase family 2 protein [Spirochaeta cellobiosiphila]|uniref:glycosyltransferase family 2 protein n=1 Tax=Spirochaeta cellobiosiphila TaxID=504483 RepID=UPI0004227302|nr:glycosyltransferase family 2 protein [Spirochaeta cellobiosiphila]